MSPEILAKLKELNAKLDEKSPRIRAYRDRVLQDGLMPITESIVSSVTDNCKRFNALVEQLPDDVLDIVISGIAIVQTYKKGAGINDAAETHMCVDLLKTAYMLGQRDGMIRARHAMADGPESIVAPEEAPDLDGDDVPDDVPSGGSVEPCVA